MDGTQPSTGFLAGRFDLLGEIGSGSSGTVYRARTHEAYGELPPGTEVAVKFLRQDRLADPTARQRLLAEGRLGQRLRSPHVARIYGVETLELLGLETTYLVMELVEGRNLRELLATSGPLVEDLTRRIGVDAARGLNALHRLGVVHRDLKPENLASTPQGQVKLMDLGLATSKASGSGTRSDFAGSLAYAAPEVLRGSRGTERSDLYSLGLVLFEMATGRHPFAEDLDTDDLIHAHLAKTPPRVSHFRPRVSAFLEELIGDLLAKDPRMRPASARELAQTLQLGERSPYWLEREQRVPVLASRSRLNRMRRPAAVSFVGRQPALRVLDELLAGAVAGRGAALRVSGPDGVGRRRLLDESVSGWLEERDPPVFLGGEAEPGFSQGQGLPFSRMLLDWYLRGDRADSPNAADRLAARMRESGMGEEDAASLGALLGGAISGTKAESRAELLARGLLHLTERHTLVIRVDRADKLGTTGTLVLEELMEKAPTHRLLLLMVTGTGGDRAFTGKRMQLRAMRASEFAALGRSLFRKGEVGGDFLAAAHRTLSGNPGNLIEALHHLAEQGQLQGRAGDYWGLKVAEPRPAPPLLSRLFERVAALPEDQRSVFQAAAVLGDRFSIAELTALSGLTELRVLEALSALQGGIARVLGGRGRFLHRDYRLLLLRGIGKRERERLHRSAADLPQARGRSPLQNGLHLSRAGEHQACLDPLLLGFEQLVSRGSRRSSSRLLARLRLHLDAVPATRENRERRLRFLLLAGRTLALTDRPEKAMQVYREASQSAHELDDLAALGEALVALATLALEAGQFLTAQGLLEQTHVALASSDAGRLAAARAFGLHARVMASLGQTDRGLYFLRQAQRTLPPRDGEYLPHLLVDRARMERLRCHFSAGLRTLRRAEQILEHHPLPLASLRVQLYRGQILSEVNDRAAVDELGKALQRARHLSNRRCQAKALLFLGEHALRSNRKDTARGWLLDAARLAQRTRDRLTAAYSQVLLGSLGVTFPDLEQTVEDLGVPALKVAWLIGEARRHGRGNRPEMVRVCADEAMDLLEVATVPLFLHLQVLRLRGDRKASRALVREIASRLLPGNSRRRFRAIAESGSALSIR